MVILVKLGLPTPHPILLPHPSSRLLYSARSSDAWAEQRFYAHASCETWRSRYRNMSGGAVGTSGQRARVLSIIVPVYNEAETVRELLARVRAVDLGPPG